MLKKKIFENKSLFIAFLLLIYAFMLVGTNGVGSVEAQTVGVSSGSTRDISDSSTTSTVNIGVSEGKIRDITYSPVDSTVRIASACIPQKKEEYTQCGGTVGLESFPSNHTILVTRSTGCNGNWLPYQNTDLGVKPGQCTTNSYCGESREEYPQCGGTEGLASYPSNHTVMVTRVKDCNGNIIRYENKDIGEQSNQCGNGNFTQVNNPGGYYINLAGGGASLDGNVGTYNAEADCNPSLGYCASKNRNTGEVYANGNVQKYICEGKVLNCDNGHNAKVLSGPEYGNFYFVNNPKIQCNRTVQLDVFDGSGNLKGFMTWYSGDCPTTTVKETSVKTATPTPTATPGKTSSPTPEVTGKGLVDVEDLPKTGPLALGTLLTALAPLGWKVRKFKSSKSSIFTPGSTWVKRQMKL